MKKEIKQSILSLAQMPHLMPKRKCAILKKMYPTYPFPFDWMFDQTTIRVRDFNKIVHQMGTVDLDQSLATLKEKNIEVTTILDKTYPRLLRHIFAPPLALFYQGRLEYAHYPDCLSIVGPRQCTLYGKKVVQKILKEYHHEVKPPQPIVSGLAAGIDGIAHKAAITYGGKTIAVIGCGIDTFYPSSHKNLQQYIGRNHLLLSEFPPGITPKRHYFPMRNRIVAGISRGTLVIEAKKRSGSLITAYRALDEGRDVFAVPGNIFELTSVGVNKLIKLGAIPVSEAEDILNQWL